LALKAALCRFRFAFISLLFLIYSKPAKVDLNQWSKIRGPPHCTWRPLTLHFVPPARSLSFHDPTGSI